MGDCPNLRAATDRTWAPPSRCWLIEKLGRVGAKNLWLAYDINMGRHGRTFTYELRRVMPLSSAGPKGTWTSVETWPLRSRTLQKVLSRGGGQQKIVSFFLKNILYKNIHSKTAHTFLQNRTNFECVRFEDQMFNQPEFAFITRLYVLRSSHFVNSHDLWAQSDRLIQHASPSMFNNSYHNWNNILLMNSRYIAWM